MDERQQIHLRNEAFLNEIKRKTGADIVSKAVVYNGPNNYNDEDVLYINAENLLKNDTTLAEALCRGNVYVKEQAQALHKPRVSLTVLCGLPGVGKTEYAQHVKEKLETAGSKEVSQNKLFGVGNIYRKDAREEHLQIVKDLMGSGENYYTIISWDDIQREYRSEKMKYLDLSEQEVCKQIALSRIDVALSAGIEVVYKGQTFDKPFRNEILQLSKDKGVTPNLVVFKANIDRLKKMPGLERIKNEMWQELEREMSNNPPENDIGWTVSIKNVGDKELEKLHSKKHNNEHTKENKLDSHNDL